MNRILQSLSIVISAWRSVLGSVLQGSIWVPFFAVAVVQVLVLLLITSFHHPLLLPIAGPLIKLLVGEEALHYPILYYALPQMYFWINLVIGAVLASIAGGAAVMLFAKYFGLRDALGAWHLAFRRAPLLIAAGILLAALWLGVVQLRSLIPDEAILQSGKVRWAVRAGVLLLSVLIQSFLVYAPAWIVLMGHRIWPALRDSARVTSKTLLPTVMAVGLPAVLLFPFSWMLGQAHFVMRESLRPELIAVAAFAVVIVQIPVNFLLVGTVTRLFVWRLKES